MADNPSAGCWQRSIVLPSERGSSRLVTDDLLGLFADFTPKFVKRYANLAGSIGDAVDAYAADVRARDFPGPEHCYGVEKAK